MFNKVTIITPPDILFNKTYSVLLICPDKELKDKFDQYLSSLDYPVNVYYYTNHDTDAKWLLTAAKIADLTVINIDNARYIRDYVSYLLSLPKTWYKTVNRDAQWGLISANKFHDFESLIKEKM